MEKNNVPGELYLTDNRIEIAVLGAIILLLLELFHSFH